MSLNTDKLNKLQRLAPVRSGDLLDRWREASESLRQWKFENLPPGTAVIVDCKRYKGPGKTVPISHDCPTDCIPVLLPNENIWWYPIDVVKRSNSVDNAK